MVVNGKKLNIGYGDHTVVRDMDINIKAGKITSIIGPNGSGKSTVLKALTRLLPYKQGSVFIDGRSLKDYSSKELARNIGVLPQIHSAPPDFQVKELVGYGRMPYQKWYQKNKSEDKNLQGQISREEQKSNEAQVAKQIFREKSEKYRSRQKTEEPYELLSSKQLYLLHQNSVKSRPEHRLQVH